MHKKTEHGSSLSKLAMIIGGAALICAAFTLIFLVLNRKVEPQVDTEASQVAATVDEWTDSVTTQLWLVDAAHELPVSYVPDSLASIGSSNVQVVAEAARAFALMNEAMEEPVVPANGYISAAAQQNLYDTKLKEYMDQGYSKERATLTIMGDYLPGGQDEHQLGLTIDVCADESLNLDYEFQNTSQGKWLLENSWKYGFVFRDHGNTDAIYKPWQLRYVGLTHAQILWELGYSLEEYLAELEEKKIYYVSSVGNAHTDLVIYFQDSLENIPEMIKEVSGDNAGHYIITCYQ